MGAGPVQLLVASSLALGLTACASRDAVFGGVRSVLEDRVAQEIQWRALDGDAAVARRVNDLLDDPLDANAAVQVALLNNPDLQAAYEELGIASANLIGLSLPRNPELEGDLGFVPGDSTPRPAFAATQNLTDLVLLPLRRQIGKAQLEAAKLRAAEEVLNLAFDVRRAFYAYVAAEQILELRHTTVDAMSAAYTIAQRLHAAGNIADLDLANERALYEQSLVDVTGAEVSALASKDRLDALMGLWGEQAQWLSSGRLEDPPETETDVPDVEARSVSKSLALAQLERAYETAARRANLGRIDGWLPEIHAGVMLEKEDGPWEMGPALALELPLFDQGQAVADAAEADARQIEQRYAAEAIRVRANARTARNRLLGAGRRARHYKAVMLPLGEEIMDHSQRQYNAMQIGVFQLLESKRQQINTAHAYIRSLRDYWFARASLDFVLAGGTPRDGSGPTEEPAVSGSVVRGAH